MKYLVLLAGVWVMITSAQAQTQREVAPGSDVPQVPATLSFRGPVAGTQMFDNDTPFARDGTDGGTVGNLFGNPSAQVTTASFAAAGNYQTSMVMTIWEVNAGSVMVADRRLVNGIPQSPAATGRFTVNFATPIAIDGDFIAGIRNTDYDPCAGNTNLATTCDGVAITQGSSPAPSDPGRGRRVAFTSGAFVPTVNTVATTGQDLPGNVNAVFRVTGNNLPVELMRMEVK